MVFDLKYLKKKCKCFLKLFFFQRGYVFSSHISDFPTFRHFPTFSDISDNGICFLICVKCCFLMNYDFKFNNVGMSECRKAFSIVGK